jgi:predicted dehydrogenase
VPNLRKTGRVEIVAICRRNAEALAQAQAYLGVPEAYTDWRIMLDESELDAVLVITPHHLHCEQTLAALERGLHVLVQKPMSLTSEDAWSMVDAAEQASCVLQVVYNLRGNPRWRAVKQALTEGAIGQLRQINVAVSYDRRWLWETEGGHIQMPEWLKDLGRSFIERMGIPESLLTDWGEEGHWRRDPAQHGGGGFINMGIHSVNTALWLGGASPAEVVAFQESAGLPVECYLNVQARLANGTLVSWTVADMPEGSNRWTIYGDDGMITVDDSEIWIHRSGEREAIEPQGPPISPDEAFVATVLDGAPNIAPAQEGAYDVALIEAAHRSVREGRIVHVEPPEGSTEPS